MSTIGRAMVDRHRTFSIKTSSSMMRTAREIFSSKMLDLMRSSFLQVNLSYQIRKIVKKWDMGHL